MMFPRYLLSLCALVFFVAVVSAEANVEEVGTDINEVEARNPLLLRTARRIIHAAVKWATKKCVKEAAYNCRQHWTNPTKLANCGKNYLQANKGRCASG